MERPLRLGFLASHGGTAFRFIHQSIADGKLNAQIVAFVSNNSKSEAMKFAREHYPDNSHHVSDRTHGSSDSDNEIARIMMEEDVDYIILSGYMKVLSAEFVKQFEGKIINSHPGDTEKYRGIYGDHVHQAVLAANETHTYPTIHLVDEEVDTGEILAQGEVKILSGETVDTLREKVKPVECELLLGVLQNLEPVA